MVSHSFLLELETAMCDSIQESTSSLSPPILPDNYLILHFCWDNFEMNEETAETTYSTHGKRAALHFTANSGTKVDRTTRRSFCFTPLQLELCLIDSNLEPIIMTDITSLNKSFLVYLMTKVFECVLPLK